MFVQPLPTNPLDESAGVFRNQAHNLFIRLHSGARLHAFWAAIRGRPADLKSLRDTTQSASVESRHYAGVRLVAIAAIQGSEGRDGQFDASFRPLHRHMYRRWVSVAAAWLAGVVFAPVELIKVGEIYFVRDGHHRISVAKVMGQSYIEAEIIVWKLGEQPQQASQQSSYSSRANLSTLSSTC